MPKDHPRTVREISAAPPLRIEIAILLAVFTAAACVRWLYPWLETQLTRTPLPTLATCPAPGDLEMRIVYIKRRGDAIEADCGPIVTGRRRP